MNSMTPDSELSIEQVVGFNLGRLRSAQGWTQVEFGKRIAEKARLPAEKAWSRQAVSNAEQGRRAFTVADLLVLSLVFELPLSALLVIPSAVARIKIGEVSLPRNYVEDPKWLHETTAGGLAEVAAALTTLHIGLDELLDHAYEVQQQAMTLLGASDRLRGMVSQEAKGAPLWTDYDTDRWPNPPSPLAHTRQENHK